MSTGRLKALLFEDKPDWVGPKVVRFLLDKPAVLITATYVAISALGLAYQYVLFASFGINIVDFAKSQDLFLVAFKNPSAMLSGLGIAATMVFYRLIAQFAMKRKSRVVRFALLSFSFIGLFRREILIPLGLLYFGFFYVFAAELEGQRILNESSDVVKVFMKTDTQSFSMLPIGSTETFLFGVEYNDELINARRSEKPSNVKPIVHALAQSEIARLDYRNSNFLVGRHWYLQRNSAVERDAAQATRP